MLVDRVTETSDNINNYEKVTTVKKERKKQRPRKGKEILHRHGKNNS